MKFRVIVGKTFQLSLETTEKQVTYFEKVCSIMAILITIGIFSAATYGAVSGDYLVFESVLNVLYKMVEAVI